jgi:hypothetical protein
LVENPQFQERNRHRLKNDIGTRREISYERAKVTELFQTRVNGVFFWIGWFSVLKLDTKEKSLFFLNLSTYKVKGMCIEWADYIQSRTALYDIRISTDYEKDKTWWHAAVQKMFIHRLTKIFQAAYCNADVCSWSSGRKDKRSDKQRRLCNRVQKE